MSQASFTILKDRKRKDGRHPIVLRISYLKEKKYLFTGYNALSNEWDQEAQMVTSDYSGKPSKTIINSYLTKNKGIVDDIHHNFVRDQNPNYTIKQFIDVYQKADKAKVTVFTAFDAKISELIRQRRVGYAAVFKSVYGVFKTFRKGKDILLKDLTPDVLEDWILSLRDNNVKDISINNYLRTIRTLYLYAIKKGWVSKDFYPFNTIKVSEFSTETSPRALDSDKLMKLLTDDVFPDLQLAKDLFVFSFYGRGISFIDVASLTEKNIQDNHIIYERKKLAKKPVRVSFPLRPEIQEIIDRHSNPERGYLLPILNVNTHITEQQKQDRIKKVRRQVNDKLKIIGKQIGIEGLSTYWSRHSYASYMFRKGMTPMMIKESLRHKNLKTTEIYIKSLGLDAIEEFEDNVFYKK